MKISLNWLRDYLTLDASVEEISAAITFLGFEVEGIETTGAPQLDRVVVGQVLTRRPHPNADRLSICSVDVGDPAGPKTIVCGAQNYKVGDRVPVAIVGAVLPGDFEIKPSKIRGEASEGMMCSGKELHVGDDHSGLLILAGTPEVGTPINAVLPAGDTVFDIEITPNRPDCLSHLGIARELAGWFRQELRYPDVPAAPRELVETQRPDLLHRITVDAPEDCPLYTATVLTGVKIGPSPEWLQARLSAVGLRPINNVVDVGNYVMLELGQPVHAFDAKRLSGAEINVRRAAVSEKLVTLDDKERTLTDEMLVIADGTKPVVIAGIMGGENSGVSEETTDLVLEVAHFRRQGIRRTSKQLNLSSDSAYRYERGVDPHGLDEARRRCIDLIQQTAGGVVAGPVMQIGGPRPWEREIVLRPDWVEARLGFPVSASEQRAALEAIELLITREEEIDGQIEWTVGVPTWRLDLDRPIDLVEEILRIHGTDKIPSVPVVSPGLLVEDDPIALYCRNVADTLVPLGFHECITYTLRSAKELASWSGPEEVDSLALANPFVADQSHLRSSLVGGLLDVLKLNQARGVVGSHFFETGRIFREEKGQKFEFVGAGFIICDQRGERVWRERETVDFFGLKSLLGRLSGQAGVDLARQPLNLATAETLGWQAGQAATAGQVKFGWVAEVGLVDLALTQQLGIEGKVYAGVFAIRPDRLTKSDARRRYQPFSTQPAALRDLALTVPPDEPAGTVLKTLLKIGRGAVDKTFDLEDVTLFDVYSGPGLSDGRKSLAFSLVFRAPDRTLTDAEVNPVFTRIQEQVAAKTAYQVRK